MSNTAGTLGAPSAYPQDSQDSLQSQLPSVSVELPSWLVVKDDRFVHTKEMRDLLNTQYEIILD